MLSDLDLCSREWITSALPQTWVSSYTFFLLPSFSQAWAESNELGGFAVSSEPFKSLNNILSAEIQDMQPSVTAWLPRSLGFCAKHSSSAEQIQAGTQQDRGKQD